MLNRLNRPLPRVQDTILSYGIFNKVAPNTPNLANIILKTRRKRTSVI